MNFSAKSFAAYVVIPIIIGLAFIVEVFLIDGCYAYDANDEVAHTFTEIPLVWRMIREGDAPFINLYNNFGTPLIGDPVINPFALQAITYLIMPGYLAATINRFLFIAGTASLLTHFYHRYFSFSLLISSVCAILIVVSPNFNYFSAHHPHQGSVFFFVLALIAQRSIKTMGVWRVLAAWLSLLILALGVGINALLLAIPFLLANQFFESNFKLDRRFILFAMLLSSVVLLMAPHLLYFFSITPLTARVSFDYSTLLPYTPQRLITDIIFFSIQPGLMHVSSAIYYSLPLLILIALGVWVARREKLNFLKIVLLGVVPLALVITILSWGELRSSIPVVKSLDLVRVLWSANVFLMIGVGYALKAVVAENSSRFYGIVLTAIFVFGFYSFALYLLSRHPQMVLGALTIRVFVGTGITIAFIAFLVLRKNLAVYGVLISIVALTMSFLPVLDLHTDLVDTVDSLVKKDVVKCYNFFFHPSSGADFQPASFLKTMKPYTRVAIQTSPVPLGSFQRVADVNVFGSSGRSIILHGPFRDYLLKRNLIRLAWNDLTYYFISFDKNELQRLGIRYVITPTLEFFQRDEWKLLEASESQSMYFYEMQDEVSTAYLLTNHHIQPAYNVQYVGNKVTIDLRSLAVEQESELVLTFIRWPGWRVTLDGMPVPLEQVDDYLLHIKVRPNDKIASFTFEPFTMPQMLFFAVASLVTLLSGIVLCRVGLRRAD